MPGAVQDNCLTVREDVDVGCRNRDAVVVGSVNCDRYLIEVVEDVEDNYLFREESYCESTLEDDQADTTLA